MPPTRLRVVVAVVVVLAFAQILFEDVLVFLGATGTVPSSSLNSAYVLVAIPLLISLTLLAILVGGAILSSDTMR